MAGKGAGMIDRELCDLTKQLMFTCLCGQNSGKIQEISGILEENSVVIGSRAHEYYTTVEQIKSELDSGKWEDGREYVYRPVKDWYQCTRLAENIYLVCGNLRIEKIFQPGNEEQAFENAGLSVTGLTETSVRISMVWKKDGKANRIIHIHISVPQEDGCGQPARRPDQAAGGTEMLPEPEKKTVDYYRRLSEKDLMTGLYNRGSFEYYVKKRLESGEGGTFYMIDLDDFKAVNDTYGHVAGDRVIMDMADILRRIFAKEAIIGRLGGDEFAVYEAGCCGRKEAEEKARAVLQDYSALSEKYGNDFQLSCSIGMYREADKETFENLYSRADEALYFSKNSYKGTFHWYYRQHRF